MSGTMTLSFGCENCRRGWPHVHAPLTPFGDAPTISEAAARARNSDPATSHAAAASLSAERLRGNQERVYKTLLTWGGMTDERLYIYGTVYPHMSPSGARTRRAELVALGLVRDSGRRERLASGRYGVVWEAVG